MTAQHDFAVQLENHPRGIVASLKGDANNEHSDQVRRALRQLLQQRAHSIVIDLRDLQFIASMTLAELIRFRKEVQSYGGRLRLSGANPQIVHLLETTHLSELFPMYDTADAALEITDPPAT